MQRKGLKLPVSICLLLVLSLVIALVNGCGTTEKMPKIGISQIVTHPALDATREGIIAGLAEKGYVEGDNIEYDYQNSEGDMSLVASIAQKFVSEEIALIVSIATPNSQAAISAAKGTETIQRLLSNLGAVAQGLSELRNLYGTGHGKHGKAKGLFARHARLAVGAAATLATFLLETHEDRAF